jgi:hypothetical protein
MAETRESSHAPSRLRVPVLEPSRWLGPKGARKSRWRARGLAISAAAVLSALIGCKGTRSEAADTSAEASRASESARTSAAVEATPLEGDARLALLNDVVDCTTLKLDGLFALGNVVLGRFALSSLKSRGDCGCMSSVLAYSMLQKFEVPDEAKAVGATGEYERVYGTIAPQDQDKEIWLVVSTDRRHFEGRAWTLKLNCKGPD